MRKITVETIYVRAIQTNRNSITAHSTKASNVSLNVHLPLYFLPLFLYDQQCNSHHPSPWVIRDNLAIEHASRVSSWVANEEETHYRILSGLISCCCLIKWLTESDAAGAGPTLPATNSMELSLRKFPTVPNALPLCFDVFGSLLENLLWTFL